MRIPWLCPLPAASAPCLCLPAWHGPRTTAKWGGAQPQPRAREARLAKQVFTDTFFFPPSVEAFQRFFNCSPLSGVRPAPCPLLARSRQLAPAPSWPARRGARRAGRVSHAPTQARMASGCQAAARLWHSRRLQPRNRHCSAQGGSRVWPRPSAAAALGPLCEGRAQGDTSARLCRGWSPAFSAVMTQHWGLHPLHPTQTHPSQPCPSLQRSFPGSIPGIKAQFSRGRWEGGAEVR